mmetsp:Transcript_11873/g.20003  ORF Transcript_11873/g.20003 Transcript_11873/m.20003 type:complete len:370 (-) Transcript_11873:327-1436(-)|eukprot:CAMPEP_0119306818 /NCGR_PEP_ID=MMETSP1333-20130426/7484_1 /TAXON_ID=418940 /ORGANISM="Scyphosphaera apsteinii, Strain RCC1455" /LENGTH=369 /DNA_ID=CAMNT_0007310223 /DNA_START=109 /DNA_END=1218 /DNA_ORIENTATION=-
MAEHDDLTKRSFNAVEDGSFDLLKRMLDEGADINAKINGKTLLHLAAAGEPDCLKLLIQRGARVDEGDFNKATPLMVAIDNSEYGAVEALLKAGAVKGLKDVHGMDAFSCAEELDDDGRMFDLLGVKLKRQQSRRSTREDDNEHEEEEEELGHGKSRLSRFRGVANSVRISNVAKGGSRPVHRRSSIVARIEKGIERRLDLDKSRSGGWLSRLSTGLTSFGMLSIPAIAAEPSFSVLNAYVPVVGTLTLLSCFALAFVLIPDTALMTSTGELDYTHDKYHIFLSRSMGVLVLTSNMLLAMIWLFFIPFYVSYRLSAVLVVGLSAMLTYLEVSSENKMAMAPLRLILPILSISFLSSMDYSSLLAIVGLH